MQPLAQVLANRLGSYWPDAICGPLVEGALIGLMVASALRIPFSYSVPVRDDAVRDNGDETLFRVSYPIPKPLHSRLRGMRVAIVNDVINAGSAIRGTLASLTECDAQTVAIGTLAIFGESANELAASHAVPLETLASFSSQIWEPTACPLCAQGIPLTEGLPI